MFDSATLWTVTCQAPLSSTVSQSLLKFVSIELVMLSNHLILCCPFFCLQSFPASVSFPVSQLFATGGQSVGASASTSVLPMNIQGWFPLRLTGLISLLSKGLSRVSSSTTIWKHQFFGAQPSLWSISHIHTWLLKEKIALTRHTFSGKVMSLLFNTLSRFFIDFLPRSKSLNFIAVVIATLVKVSWRLLGQVFCPLGVPLRSSHIFYPTLWYDALLQLSWSHETPHGQHFQDGRAKRPNSGFLMALLNYITHHETTHHWTLSLSKRIN